MPAFFTTPLSALTSRWRIFYEESADLNPRDERSDFQELRGTQNDCRIYRHGQSQLAVSTESGGYYAKLARIPGLRPKTGSVLVFPDALLHTVAQAIRARYKPQSTPEQTAPNQTRMLEARKSLKNPRPTASRSV